MEIQTTHPTERPEPETMSDRELLMEIVRTMRVMEMAVINLSKSPMMAALGGGMLQR